MSSFFQGSGSNPTPNFFRLSFCPFFFHHFLLNVYKDFIDVSDVWRIGRNNFILEQWEEIFYITIICGAMWYDLLILPLSVARCDMTFLYWYCLWRDVIWPFYTAIRRGRRCVRCDMTFLYCYYMWRDVLWPFYTAIRRGAPMWYNRKYTHFVNIYIVVVHSIFINSKICFSVYHPRPSFFFTFENTVFIWKLYHIY